MKTVIFVKVDYINFTNTIYKTTVVLDFSYCDFYCDIG